MSLAGSPDRAQTPDCTRRALAEMASDSNSLPFVLDDTEKTQDDVLVETLKSIVHIVPGGRSKKISRGVDQARFPDLRWSTFGLSSSPKPIAELAAKANWEMTPGDKVRLPDISVPDPHSGGIFDRISGTKPERAAKSVHLIKELEDGYQSNRGHVFRAWISFLLREDRTEEISDLVDRFVDRACTDKQGWEVRFAALAQLGRLDEARQAIQPGLALAPGFTIARYRAGVQSDHPIYLAQRERIIEGMRKAGVPEG
jgi:hypothetical protein